MSAASRWEAAGTRIVPTKDPATGKFLKRAELPSLALNRAQIAGGLGFELAAPVEAGGLEWLPEHGSPWGSPIGCAWAAEFSERQEATS